MKKCDCCGFDGENEKMRVKGNELWVNLTEEEIQERVKRHFRREERK